MKLILTIGFSIFLLFGILAWSYISAGCSTDFEYRKSRIVAHLKEVALPVEFLSFDSIGSSDCKTSFDYKSETENINFVVVDGGKVMWWDYNERGE